MRKYFQGDDSKVLKWGLDLSGGKTVRISLLDHNNRIVTNPDDLKQAVNELYNRINKMGVSERTIRIENSTILLDFPGSQNLSATDLVKASAMYFHVVNEKFGSQNPTLASSVNQFLQDVWNEAVVTNRKDIESINEIAWKHLGGDSTSSTHLLPRSDYAKALHQQGLRLANPKEREASSTFEDTLTQVAMFRGEDSAEWGNQLHPLLFVFHNYALEGSSLENIQAGYDASQGNTLSFAVKRSYEKAQERGNGSPREDFYMWTSQFAEDRIVGTPKETYSKGHGWRMAVILNGTVITAPALNAALREGGTISGRFSQREVNQLVADLKAGSLSFTPRILSEENVSPELGHEERMKGIIASVVSLVLVVAAMIGYYRFAGVVASLAVILNIFIMWGVLQNIGAALTLPGIAGIVLTIGMAVDANVLVFERVREEFKISGRIGSAIQAGYRKAFSAIIDSNITSIIAAVILIQFDSGPIKGFAITLIIGIISSMFTALFMTRYFFAGWVRKACDETISSRNKF
jgi:SecD/SecF fusion protein